jgi:hypothetical protein
LRVFLQAIHNWLPLYITDSQPSAEHHLRPLDRTGRSSFSLRRNPCAASTLLLWNEKAPTSAPLDLRQWEQGIGDVLLDLQDDALQRRPSVCSVPGRSGSGGRHRRDRPRLGRRGGRVASAGPPVRGRTRRRQGTGAPS